MQALHNQLPFITAVYFNSDKDSLIIGNKYGIIYSYEITNYNEKIILQYQNMSNINIAKKLEIKTDHSLKITCIDVTGKNELLASFSNGAIAVYSHEAKNTECMYIYVIKYNL